VPGSRSSDSFDKFCSDDRSVFVSEPEEDFATLFEASHKAQRFEKGQTIEGRIVAIGPEVAFVDVGGKGEAAIELDELKDDEGNLEVAVGDRIQAVVVSTDGGLTLSRKLARRAATARQLHDAFQTGLPVEGRVEQPVKGGFEVRIGRHRAFCPISQIDIVRNTDPSLHQGRVYRFRIIEYKEGGRNLIVSRRALLEEEQRASAAEIRQSIVVDAVITGRVASVREFGAFVDLGAGVQGLLHVSEMAWSRVSDAGHLVKPGDEITVKVLRLDDDKQKIALGLKQLSADPWSNVNDRYATGQVRTGRVTRIAEFGAFVELEPGIEGLVPLSEAGVASRRDLARTFPIGTSVQVAVLEIDPAARRMRLSAKAILDAREAAVVREYTERHATASAEGFGSLADKLRSALEPREK
jgi:small subunit ribosomal protein S1